MIHEKLKKETTLLHRNVERNSMLKRVMDPNLTVDYYSIIIEKFYHFHQEIETQLVKFNNQHKLITDLDNRLKCDFLEADIVELNIVKTNLPKRYIEINTAEDFFGVLYVIEGSTLGGQYIIPKLNVSLPELKHSYYNGFGDETRNLWLTFINQLTSTQDALNHEEVVKSANLTFSTLIELFKE
ncbi:biliverdin-producing heme oxygenase [Flavobacterium sp. K5-23]|uniref:biliverdin-producing heme oxygenase n=1 Tax=Flavobacterium sp. K5-23 TaxID=2746225 RepID=UPI00200CCF02|nr:biliverdin-producing heme oxygenase [Flavobacterium sp. K5-23]UQD56715.1 biliverdin-producing heme oxygenase [Flavobacterium sp. K5-23]